MSKEERDLAVKTENQNHTPMKAWRNRPKGERGKTRKKNFNQRVTPVFGHERQEKSSECNEIGELTEWRGYSTS